MKVFNRIVVILILAGLFSLSLFIMFSAFDFGGYLLADLPNVLGFAIIQEAIASFVANLESGSTNIFVIATMGLLALVGLVLFIIELIPSSPRKVKMQQGTYVTRRAVEAAATEAVEQNPNVLHSNIKVKARRKSGAKVKIRASVEEGEDARNARSEVQEGVQRHMDEVGIPVGRLKVRIDESAPSTSKTRVR